MPTSVSQRLNILCIMFKIIAFFIITLFAWLQVMVWTHKTSLALSLFIEVLVLSQESESSCICMLGVSIFLFLRFFDWILERFRQCGISRIVSTVWYF